MKEELTQILENLEESIILLSDSKAEFANKRFLCSFSKHILNVLPQLPDNIVEIDEPSKMTRIKDHL